MFYYFIKHQKGGGLPRRQVGLRAFAQPSNYIITHPCLSVNTLVLFHLPRQFSICELTITQHNRKHCRD